MSMRAYCSTNIERSADEQSPYRLTMMAGVLPDGWPGETVVEGRTKLHLPPVTSENGANMTGPGQKGERSVFHNQAMAANRTRSVLLMDYELRSGWLAGAEKDVRYLDALSASGARAHRLCHELAPELVARLDLTLCDLDKKAIGWAEANHRENPPPPPVGFRCIVGDARQEALKQGWQWVDIDPFGSPIPFLDGVMQSTARKAVLEITATDTAALTGSSKTALARRYGAQARLDSLAHDTGLRILLAVVAQAAAKHDRCIEPLLSIWDGHHLRVSVRVRRSVEGANELDGTLGWRIAEPTEDETKEPGIPHTLVPLTYPVSRDDPRVSGPLWIGAMGDCDAMSWLTEERAMEMCAPDADKDGAKEGRKMAARAVRSLSKEAQCIHIPSVYCVDHLASHLGLHSPPSPSKMATLLNGEGHLAAVANYGKPAIRTDAPWKIIEEVASSLQ